MSEPRICAINIGPRERRRRLLAGLVFLVVGFGLAVALFTVGAGRGWRLILCLPLWLGLLGVFQARAST